MNQVHNKVCLIFSGLIIGSFVTTVTAIAVAANEPHHIHIDPITTTTTTTTTTSTTTPNILDERTPMGSDANNPCLFTEFRVADHFIIQESGNDDDMYTYYPILPETFAEILFIFNSTHNFAVIQIENDAFQQFPAHQIPLARPVRMNSR